MLSPANLYKMTPRDGTCFFSSKSRGKGTGSFDSGKETFGLKMRETGAFATEHQMDGDIYSLKMRRQSHFLVGKGFLC